MAQIDLPEFLEFLGKPFSDLSLLQKALTAPGAEGDKEGDLKERELYEGNRLLAQIGTPLHHLAVKRLVLEGVPRQEADALLKSSLAHLEKRAKSIGFYCLIKPNPRQKGVVSKSTLRLVYSAIVGAVYESCGRNESKTTCVVNRLYFDPIPGLEENQTTSLPELEIKHTVDSWEDFINVHEIEPGSPHNNMVSLKTLRNAPFLVDDLSPQGLPEATQSWESLQSPIQQYDEMPSTPSYQLDDVLGNFGDILEIADYSTPLTLDPYSSQLDSPSYGAFDKTDEILSIDQGGHTVHETAMPAAMATLASAPTELHPPVSNVKSREARAADLNAVSPSSKKRRSGGEETISDQLSNYIRREKRRCLSTGLTFLDADLASATSNLHQSSLQILYFGIGSPEVLIVLQELLKIRREQSTDEKSRERRNLPPAARIIVIEHEDAKKAYGSFRKRRHVLQLFDDCSAKSLAPIEPFITSTVQTIAIKRTPRMGNPHNLEISAISNRMLMQCYPDLMPNDPTYEKKRIYMTQLRNFGQRLRLLADRFHSGILGLIPLPSNEPSLVQALTITDAAIFRIPLNKFKAFVDELDDKLGNILREMSLAVSDVVEAIFNEERDHLEDFAIEHCEQAQILQLPRGSPEFLKMLSQPQ